MSLVKEVNVRIKAYYEDIIFALRFVSPPWKRKAVLLQTPEHNNIGDNAIVLAELKILQDYFGDRAKIIEVTMSEYIRFKKIIKLLVRKKDFVTTEGGGDMGNIWKFPESQRQDAMITFQDNILMVFPETIYYDNTNDGKYCLNKSIDIYSSHKNLTIIAREKYSYEIMKETYKKNSVILTPDIVLFLDPEYFDIDVNAERHGALLCLRSDVERIISDDDYNKIISSVKNMEYAFTDMYSDLHSNCKNRKDIVVKKMKEFSRAELVITDRLHGMIFCAITGTPCVALPNNHHKIKGVYEWIKDLDYIKFIDDINDVGDAVNQVLSSKCRKYPAEALREHFECIKKIW